MTDGTCSVTDCVEPVRIKKRALCQPHYSAAWYRGEFGHTRTGRKMHRLELQSDSMRVGKCSICGPVDLVMSNRKLVCKNSNDESNRRHRHGISPERMTEMLDAIGWACEVCARDLRNEVYCIDHDHACCPKGKSCGECVRGILCRRCNAGIGMFLDNPDFADAAAAYLRRVEKPSTYDQPAELEKPSTYARWADLQKPSTYAFASTT